MIPGQAPPNLEERKLFESVEVFWSDPYNSIVFRKPHIEPIEDEV